MKNLFNYLKLLSLGLICYQNLGLADVPAEKQAVSVETGLYSLSTTSSSASGVGLASAEYLRVINMKWAGSLAYSQFFSNPSNFSSNIYGFDLLGHWCWKPCRPYKKENDPTNARYFPRWSYILQGGFSQRFIQLDERTVGFNGLRIGGEVQFLQQTSLAWFGRTFISRMTNGTSDMNLIGITVGARWWFGE